MHAWGVPQLPPLRRHRRLVSAVSLQFMLHGVAWLGCAAQAGGEGLCKSPIARPRGHAAAYLATCTGARSPVPWLPPVAAAQHWSAGACAQGSYTSQVASYLHYITLHKLYVLEAKDPTADCCSHCCSEASQLLGALDEAAAFCSRALEELDRGGGSTAGSGRSFAAHVQRAVDVSALATAVAGLESGVLELCLTTEPRGASVHGVVANCMQCLVTCFGVGARALEWVHNTSIFQQDFPLGRLLTLVYSILGLLDMACSRHTPLQAAICPQLDAQAGLLLAGLRGCAGLLASPEYLRAHELRERRPGGLLLVCVHPDSTTQHRGCPVDETMHHMVHAKLRLPQCSLFKTNGK